MTSPPSRFDARRRYRRFPMGSLKLSRAGSLQDLVIALVALLVALVHHRGSYSVTLGNRAAAFPSAREMRGILGWRVTEED